MRFIATIFVVICSLFLRGAYAEEGKAGGMTFSLGFESYPGRLFYRLDGFRYINGTMRDSRYNPMFEDVDFTVVSLRVANLVPLGFDGFSAGLEVGMSMPLSGYRESWNLPWLTPKFTGDIYYPSFC